MNRDIKFRAYIKFLHEIHSVDEVYRSGGCMTDDYPYALAHDDVVLMQFTGLTDKNGKDIYEGDILISELGRVCKIEWHEYQAGFDCTFIKDTNFKKDIDMSGGFKNPHLGILTKVIGNIHENPELLK